MDLRIFSKSIFFGPLLVLLLFGCATQIRTPLEPPPFPDEGAGAKWGGSIEEVRAAVEKGGNRVFQDDTDKSPYALYASGTVLGEPVIFSCFFTPKSKKFFRVDLTYKDPRAYEKVKTELMQRFKSPTHSQKDTDHWFWTNNSLVILQKEPSFFQVSYSNGPFLSLNHREGNGLSGR